MTDLRTKYLDVIQSVVTRMAGNQFQARAWSVALGSAIIGFAASKDGNLRAALLAAIPVLIFWSMDAYYLGLERKFRSLYNRECMIPTDPPNFSLNPGVVTAAESITAFFRFAVWSVHAPVLLLSIGVFLYGARHPPKPEPVAKPITCVCSQPPRQ